MHARGACASPTLVPQWLAKRTAITGRPGAGEPLTEEVQRAVYVVKGLVLIASSALAYFLSRALLSQLVKVALGVPLVQRVIDAAEAASASARQATPKLRKQAAALLNRLPGGAAGPEGLAARKLGEPAGKGESQRSDATARVAEAGSAAPRDTSQWERAAPRGQEGRGGGDRRPPAGLTAAGAVKAPPPPPPLVPTAQAALFTAGQGRQGPAGAAARLPQGPPGRASSSGLAGFETAGGAGGAAEPATAPLGSGELPSSQASGGDVRGSGTADGGAGGGVLWRRGGGGASLLSDRWAGASSPAVTEEAPQDVAGSKAVTTRPADKSAAQAVGQGTDGASPGGGGAGAAEVAPLKPGHNGGVPHGLAHGRAGLGKTPEYGAAPFELASYQSGAGKDPWFG